MSFKAARYFPGTQGPGTVGAKAKSGKSQIGERKVKTSTRVRKARSTEGSQRSARSGTIVLEPLLRRKRRHI